MIKSFKSRSLKRFYEKGDVTKLPPGQVPKIRVMLGRLDAASDLKDMNVPGYNLHKLTGNLKDLFAVTVTGNYRIIFKFENGDAYDVDYGDYH